MTLRTRLLLSHLALVVVVLVGVEAAISAFSERRLENLVVKEVDRSAVASVEALRQLPENATVAEIDAVADRLGLVLSAQVTVVGADGHVIGDSDVALDRIGSLDPQGAEPEIRDALRTGSGSSRRWDPASDREMVFAARSLPGGRAVRAGRPLEEVRAVTGATRGAVLAIGALAAMLAALLAGGISSALARPIAEVESSARAMASGDLQRRSNVRRNDELGALANALNELAASFAATIDEVTSERNRLAAILSGMVEGVMVTDASGRILLVNPSLREILGVTGEVTGRPILEAIRSAELHEMVKAVLDGGQPIARLLRVPGPPELTLEVRFSLLRGEGVPITGLVAVFHDITELKRLEQVRKDFVANASHELKTPIAAILGASETLSGGALSDPEAGPRFLSVIGRHAQRLAALVEDLLDLSRLEARETSESRPVDPRDALTRALAALRDEATAKGLTVSVEPSSTPAVRGDPVLMERALTNLVQNAVRYTKSGGRVTLRAVAAGDAVRFEVEDTGIGIPRQALPRIFERFYRVDPARSRELGGTGLGLAIVKHAVEAMGGSVSVRSVPDRGSTFSFTLPVWTGVETVTRP